MEIKEYLEAKLRSIAQGEIIWKEGKLYLSGKEILEVFYSPPPSFQVLVSMPYYLKFNMHIEEGRKLALFTDLYYFTGAKAKGRKIEVLYGPEVTETKVEVESWKVCQKYAVRSIYKTRHFEVWEALRPFEDWEYFGFLQTSFPGQGEKRFYADHFAGRKRLSEEKAIWKLRGLIKEEIAEAKYWMLRDKPIPKVPLLDVTFKPNPKCPRKNPRSQELFRLLCSLRASGKEFVEGLLLESPI